MEVDGIRRFANASLSNAVWEMYIKTPERRLQLHALLGRYFMAMEPCDRKLHELPYHLEIAGQWSKLKHALIKIEMFKCWWTPRHKEEFIKLWASLSKHPSFRTAADGYVTSNLDPALYPVPNARPCYDMVAEYIKALDEFVGKFGKPEEEVAEVALRVSDFLLEFATSGFEISADAPRFSRPELITSDLASLGVPFLQLDDNGRSCVNVPLQRSAIEAQDDPDDAGGPPQRAASDQMPTCTTYNYRRWMWTQFPLVALANCGERFKKGVLDRWPRNDDGSLQESNDVAGMLPPALEKQLDLMLSPPSSPTSGEGSGAGALTDSAMPGELDTLEGEESLSLKAPLSVTASTRLTVLPRLPPAKVSGHHSKLQGRDADRHAQYHLKVQAAQAAVANDRAALDNFVRQRNVLTTQIAKMRDEYGELSAAEAAATDDEMYLGRLKAKYRKLMKQQANADLLSRNYRCVLLMCQRHPPRSDVLIEDLENQMTQDQLIINAVQQRSATAAREAAATAQDAQALLKAMEGNAKVQHEILENLHVQRESLWNEKEQRRDRQKKKRVAERRAVGDLDARQEQRMAKKDEANRAKAAARERELTAVREQLELWDHRVAVINDKTGISDPQQFFEKFTNRDVLEKQMEEMKKVAEARLAELKKGAAAAESELEEVRYGAFAMNGSSRELRDKDGELAESSQRLKRAKERFESMQSLLHGVTAGAQHIGEIVGIQKTKGQQQSTQETLELLEQLLTELLDEEEDGAGGGGGAGGAGAKGAASPTKGAGMGDSVYDQEMEQRAKEMIAPHLLLLGQGDDATPSVGSDDEDAPVDLWGQGKADKLNAVPSRDAMKASSKKEVKDMLRGQSRRKSVQGGKLSTS